MLRNFDKWQKMWKNDIEKYEKYRDRMNNSAFNKNHKVNARQAINDVTLQDRQERSVEDRKNKDLLSVTLRPVIDNFGSEWMASLRQAEHDNEYDGMHLLQGQHNNSIEEPSIESTDFDPMRSQLSSLSMWNESRRTRANLSLPFYKRRKQFDQEFVSDADQPLEKRRLTVCYHPHPPTNVAELRAVPENGGIPFPNAYNGRFITQPRLP